MRDLFTGVFCPNDCDRLRPVVSSSAAADSDYDLLLSKIADGHREVVKAFHIGGRVTYIGCEHTGDLIMTSNPKGFRNSQLYSMDWMVRINANATVTVLKNRWGNNAVRDIPPNQGVPQ